MEAISNKKEESLFLMPFDIFPLACKMKKDKLLEKGKYKIISQKESNITYILYRRLSDGNYCILSIFWNKQISYNCEV
jgi:hypothetical protein